MDDQVPMPADETARLRALSRYRILDTPPDPAFDDLTALAASICDAPMARITLVDAHREWYKSQVGPALREAARESGFCTHAIGDPRTMLEVRDAREDPRFRTNSLVTAEPSVRFYAGQPCVTEDGYALGTISVLDLRPRALTPGQRCAMEALSRQVIDRLEHRRARREVVEREHVLGAVMDSVAAEIVYYDTDARTRLWNAHYERSFRESVGRPPHCGEPMEALIRERAHGAGLSPEAIEAFMSRRMAYHRDPQGELYVDLPNGGALLIREVPVPSGGFVATLIDISPLRRAERALEERAHELEHLAQTDPLTGLANRRRFFDIARQECVRAERYERPISVVSLDVDHFKRVNDTHGHDAGDQVLRHVAEVARYTARDQDVVARLGGEEFCVLLPETGRAAARQFAERLRQRIEAKPTATNAGVITVTASIGVAERRPGELGIEETIRRADARLYDAKHRGRNRVVTDDTNLSAQPSLRPNLEDQSPSGHPL